MPETCTKTRCFAKHHAVTRVIQGQTQGHTVVNVGMTGKRLTLRKKKDGKGKEQKGMERNKRKGRKKEWKGAKRKEQEENQRRLAMQNCKYQPCSLTRDTKTHY